MLIEANNLNYYVGNKPILKGISLSLYPQQIVTLLGPNGAGKSTLIKILLGLLNPSSGRVERQAGLKIGYVPQAFNRQTWMPITVLDLLKLYIPQLDTNHTLFEQ
ncbi:MAG: ATP-binding cassette domain-containing protein, partial [Gammaproteobacteria bacterium]